jgi:hypothetical protein
LAGGCPPLTDMTTHVFPMLDMFEKTDGKVELRHQSPVRSSGIEASATIK